MNSTVTMFILELGMVEPRPCHERFPMKPRSWQLTDVTAWGAEFRFDLVGVDRRNGASAPADGSRRGRHHRHCPTRGRLTAGKWLGKDEHGLATAILTTRNSVTISMSQNAENVRTEHDSLIEIVVFAGRLLDAKRARYQMLVANLSALGVWATGFV